MRVLYTDYHYALLAECFKRAEDGTCVPGYGAMFAYARRPHLPHEARRQLLHVAREACFSEEDFLLTPHDGKG